MYRLLVVTDRPQVRELFAAMQPQDLADYKAPHFRNTVDGAEQCLKEHSIDAVAIDHSPAFDEFRKYMDTQQRDLPMFVLEETPDGQKLVMKELSHVLIRLNADDGNLTYDQIPKMEQLRSKWVKKVLCGLIPTEEAMRRHVLLYRYQPGVDTPSVLVRFGIPENDDFLSERWHYGSDRLETALRNFFGFEHAGMKMQVAVISPEEVRIFVTPSDPSVALQEDMVHDYIAETADQVDKYLGLTMKLLDFRKVSGLKAFKTAE